MSDQSTVQHFPANRLQAPWLESEVRSTGLDVLHRSEQQGRRGMRCTVACVVRARYPRASPPGALGTGYPSEETAALAKVRAAEAIPSRTGGGTFGIALKSLQIQPFPTPDTAPDFRD
jgi:hypothetical protein